MADYTQPQGRELDWDGIIENDSTFTLIPPGDYDFTVKHMERARHNGSEKLPPCGKAVLTLEMRGVNASGEMRHNLFLHSSTEGLLCAFFTAIGQRRKGERLQMNWNRVVGANGRAKVSIRKYTSKGIEYETNDVKEFYESVASASAQPQQQQIQGQQSMQSQQPTNFQTGRF